MLARKDEKPRSLPGHMNMPSLPQGDLRESAGQHGKQKLRDLNMDSAANQPTSAENHGHADHHMKSEQGATKPNAKVDSKMRMRALLKWQVRQGCIYFLALGSSCLGLMSACMLPLTLFPVHKSRTYTRAEASCV